VGIATGDSFMWLKLTLTSGTQTCVDLSKVVYMNEHKSGGTQLFFGFEVTTNESRLQKEIIVQERLEHVAKKVKAVGV
jgi:hypothetical protein